MRVIFRFLIRAGVTVAFSGLLLTTGSRLGPRSKLWERFRIKTSLMASRIDSRAGPREIRRSEKVGEYCLEVGEVESFLREHGFVRNPLSRLKTCDGRIEDGSWVKRDGVFSRRQIHVMFFQKDTDIEVYAHEEFSSINPFTAVRHYNGVDQDEAKGVKEAEKIFSNLNDK